MIIFLYIVFSVYSYWTRPEIRYYEVQSGGIVQEKRYTGLILRSEEVINSESTGFIHYYVKEGRRTGVNHPVYSIDASGALEQYLKAHPEAEGEMSAEEKNDLLTKLQNFSIAFENQNFSELYTLKDSLETDALSLHGRLEPEELDQAMRDLGIRYQTVNSGKAGIVLMTVDGMENLNEKAVTREIFQHPKCSVRSIHSGQEVREGEPAYKLITGERWEIVFPVTEEERGKYQDVKSITVYFPDQNLTAGADLSLYTARDGGVYGKLSLNDYMESFLSERFISFTLPSDANTGLKIPISAITKKDFYVVPKDFMGTENGETGFYRLDGKEGEKTSFVPTEIYRIDERYCYIRISDGSDPRLLKTGDILRKRGTQQSYSVGPVKTIQGVYNINKGYCVFRQILPLESNEDYMIVQDKNDYSIAVYDHIVLNASQVSEGQVIYQ